MRAAMMAALLWTLPAASMAAPDAQAWAQWQQQQQQQTLHEAYPNPRTPGQPWVKVGVRSQTLSVFSAAGALEKRYDISTAKRGVGETQNSYQTPRGWHRICEKIGDGAPSDTIIFRREVTPWKYTPELHAEYPNKDWILTRILWLCGQEPGLNQGSRDGVLVDSYARYIYIHGAGRHVPMGTPTSLGCVRMTSEAVIELFERTPVGMEVLIDENG
jgi:lipoprotein-anchoring transpeptidase ErfK/SrfK